MHFSIKQWLVSYKSNFLAQRRPRRNQHRLKQNNLFIFPSILGGCYLLLIMLLWLLGTNYDNNLILGLCYLLLSIMLVSILHCYFNLQGLQVSSCKSSAVFCGELAMIKLKFERASLKTHTSIAVNWHSQVHNGTVQQPGQVQILDWQNRTSVEVLFPVVTISRGIFQPPRLAIKSYYPLGLLRCWCVLAIDSPVIVYPKPIAGNASQIASSVNNSSAKPRDTQTLAAEREYQDLQIYREGEPVNQIAWKHYARTEVLYKKNYAYLAGDHCSLNWDNYPGIASELRLQYLCHQAIKLSALRQVFSLELPGCTIAMASGEEHYRQVLHALALFPENV